MKEPLEYIGFMEKVVSGISHEINNNLSVIKENSGLLEDLLFMAEKSGMENPFSERMKKALGSIKESLKKGAAASLDLNRFSHLSRIEETQTSIKEAVNLMARINNKNASRAGVTIEVDEISPEKGISICQAKFCRLIHLIIDAYVRSSSSGDLLKIDFSESDGKCFLSFMRDSDDSGFPERFYSSETSKIISTLASDIKLDLIVDNTGAKIRFLSA